MSNAPSNLSSEWMEIFEEAYFNSDNHPKRITYDPISKSYNLTVKNYRPVCTVKDKDRLSFLKLSDLAFTCKMRQEHDNYILEIGEVRYQSKFIPFVGVLAKSAGNDWAAKWSNLVTKYCHKREKPPLIEIGLKRSSIPTITGNPAKRRVTEIEHYSWDQLKNSAGFIMSMSTTMGPGQIKGTILTEDAADLYWDKTRSQLLTINRNGSNLNHFEFDLTKRAHNFTPELAGGETLKSVNNLVLGHQWVAIASSETNQILIKSLISSHATLLDVDNLSDISLSSTNQLLVCTSSTVQMVHIFPSAGAIHRELMYTITAHRGTACSAAVQVGMTILVLDTSNNCVWVCVGQRIERVAIEKGELHTPTSMCLHKAEEQLVTLIIIDSGSRRVVQLILSLITYRTELTVVFQEVSDNMGKHTSKRVVSNGEGIFLLCNSEARVVSRCVRSPLSQLSEKLSDFRAAARDGQLSVEEVGKLASSGIELTVEIFQESRMKLLAMFFDSLVETIKAPHKISDEERQACLGVIDEMERVSLPSVGQIVDFFSASRKIHNLTSQFKSTSHFSDTESEDEEPLALEQQSEQVYDKYPMREPSVSTEPNSSLYLIDGSHWLGKFVVDDESLHGELYGKSLCLHLNFQAIKAKIATDLQRLLSKGAFIVPETFLSMQPIIDVSTMCCPATQVFLGSGASSCLRVISNVIPDCQNWTEVMTIRQDGSKMTLNNFIKEFHQPPEFLLAPGGGKVPILGLVELLAVSKLLCDPYLAAKFLWVTNLEDEIVGAQVVKLNTNTSFSFEEYPALEGTEKDVYTMGRSAEATIKWEQMNTNQRLVFTNTLKGLVKFGSCAFLRELFARFNPVPVFGDMPKEIFRNLRARLALWMQDQGRLYLSD